MLICVLILLQLEREAKTTLQTNQLNEEILQLNLTIRNQNEKILQLNGDILKLREDCQTFAGDKEREAKQKHEVEKKLEEATKETNKWRSDYLTLERSKSEEILKLNEDIHCFNVQLQQTLKENEQLRVEMRCKYFHDLPVCLHFHLSSLIILQNTHLRMKDEDLTHHLATGNGVENRILDGTFRLFDRVSEAPQYSR